MFDMTPTWCHPTRILNSESLLLFHPKARPYLQPMQTLTMRNPGAVIDNLTATIVCVKILKRVVPHKKAPQNHHFLWANWFQFGTSLQIGCWPIRIGVILVVASQLWLPMLEVLGVPLVMSPLPCCGFVIRSLPQAGGWPTRVALGTWCFWWKRQLANSEKPTVHSFHGICITVGWVESFFCIYTVSISMILFVEICLCNEAPLLGSFSLPLWRGCCHCLAFGGRPPGESLHHHLCVCRAVGCMTLRPRDVHQQRLRKRRESRGP